MRGVLCKGPAATEEREGGGKKGGMRGREGGRGKRKRWMEGAGGERQDRETEREIA